MVFFDQFELMRNTQNLHTNFHSISKTELITFSSFQPFVCIIDTFLFSFQKSNPLIYADWLSCGAYDTADRLSPICLCIRTLPNPIASLQWIERKQLKTMKWFRFSFLFSFFGMYLRARNGCASTWIWSWDMNKHKVDFFSYSLTLPVHTIRKIEMKLSEQVKETKRKWKQKKKDEAKKHTENHDSQPGSDSKKDMPSANTRRWYVKCRCQIVRFSSNFPRCNCLSEKSKEKRRKIEKLKRFERGAPF